MRTASAGNHRDELCPDCREPAGLDLAPSYPRRERRAASTGRRGVLLGAMATMMTSRATAAYATAATDARLIVINMRGGVDGLSMCVPYGDRKLAGLRAALLDRPVGMPGGMLDLGGYFGLHPALRNFHAMYAAGQGLVVHAVGNCALTRSHFEGQDFLQSGAGELLTDGWLNRAIGLMPSVAGGIERGVALDNVTPLLLRGPTATAGWTSTPFQPPGKALAAAMLGLAKTDTLIGPATTIGMRDRTVLGQFQHAHSAPPASLSAAGSLAWQAGTFLGAATGPRVAALRLSPLDTHNDQRSRLAEGLADLDQMLWALQRTLGSAWVNTVVMTLTEFGRTVRVNGSGGTDHGTAFAMLLAGGAVDGGRVVASWPGLNPGQLYEGRDLQPTTDVRSVAMGVLGGHMGLSESALAAVFPTAGGLKPLRGLIRG